MENELRIYNAFFTRGKDPSKIYLFIPYNSRSLLIDGTFEEELKPGCFSRSLRSGRDVKSFWNHNSGMVLGSTKAQTMQIKDGPKGLNITLDPPNNTWGRDALESINRGDTDGCSFGFTPKKVRYDDEENVRYIIDAELWEISPTPNPAYQGSTAYARSKQQNNKTEQIKSFFNRDGSKKEMTREQIQNKLDRNNRFWLQDQDFKSLTPQL